MPDWILTEAGVLAAVLFLLISALAVEYVRMRQAFQTQLDERINKHLGDLLALQLVLREHSATSSKAADASELLGKLLASSFEGTNRTLSEVRDLIKEMSWALKEHMQDANRR